MCAFSFTVFVSAFLLLPTAPFRIISLGGSEFAAGLFLGFLTYASAFSAPLTGALADRYGRRRVLIVCSLAITGFSAAYALTDSYQLQLSLVPFHGVFWSGLLAASAAHLTDMLPAARRTEGIGYWGLSTVLAIAVAPGLGFWLLRHGWAYVCAASAAMNLAMAAIAAFAVRTTPAADAVPHRPGALVEWRVVWTSISLFLYSFGYGGITSFVALYAETNGVVPKSLYFTVLAITIASTRPISGPLADRIGARRVFVPCLVLIAIGLGLLAYSGTRPWLIVSAIVFGAGFGSAYPVYASYVIQNVGANRRGAAFGGILAAFDTGIGTGSIATGWLIAHFGFQVAFATAALLSLVSIPYFLYAERRFLLATVAVTAPGAA
jgi:MFS family permease